MGLLDTILGKSWVAHFFNPNHAPAGNAKGGQFTSGKGGATSRKDNASTVAATVKQHADALYENIATVRPPAATIERSEAGSRQTIHVKHELSTAAERDKLVTRIASSLQEQGYKPLPATNSPSWRWLHQSGTSRAVLWNAAKFTEVYIEPGGE
jgi:hypothetical protein